MTDWPIPSALPIATTDSPTLTLSELPSLETLMLLSVSASIALLSTDIIARSFEESVPLIAASTVSLSLNVTERLDDDSTT